MKAQPLVSIIIPTYNRAHLIGETLDSIIAQIYQNWECIVVDDGSTDKTDDVMKTYCEKDSRFKYYHRPEEHVPGGCGARNFGFKKSLGDYIQWFDSDDLMLPIKLDLKVKAILAHEVDFVVSKSKFFNHKNNTFFNYKFENGEVDFLKYAIDYPDWVTNDLFVKQSLVNNIAFNENLKAGQEYNFNCKLLLKTTNFYKLDKFLTSRRYNKGSIQGQRDLNKQHHHEKMFETYWYNYLELKEQADSPKFNRFSLLKCVNSYLIATSIKLPVNFKRELKKVFPKRYYYFYLAIASKTFTGKYYYFYEKLRKNEVFNTYKK